MIPKAISDIKKFKNLLGGIVKFGLNSPAFIMLSKNRPADFFGRKKGMSYNTHISCVAAAYTEVVNFLFGLDYTEQGFNGNVVDIFVSPGLIENNSDKFVIFMISAI